MAFGLVEYGAPLCELPLAVFDPAPAAVLLPGVWLLVVVDCWLMSGLVLVAVPEVPA